MNLSHTKIGIANENNSRIQEKNGLKKLQNTESRPHVLLCIDIINYFKACINSKFKLP